MQSGTASKLQRNIFRTLVYADVFDYPLTFFEVQKFLIGDTQVTLEIVQRELKIIVDSKQICTNEGFYFLKGREELVALRQKRENWSGEKLEIAKKTVEKLKFIPWIKMIGVTGALAMMNAKEEDDIDLMVITSADHLWLTRLLIFLLCPILGIKRRKPKDRMVKNKICFNLFLEEGHLELLQRNLFLAHEVCQVKPLVNKNRTYEKFLWGNRWVEKFLPSGIKISSKFKVQNSKLNGGHLIFQYLPAGRQDFNVLISFFEILAYKLQLLYMKPKMTCEDISLKKAFFHPHNLTQKILNDFKDKLALLGIDKKTQSSL